MAVNRKEPQGSNAGTVTLLGIPSDENSTFMKGPALAPAVIRGALFSGSANLCAEGGLDLSRGKRLVDAGDLETNPDFRVIEETIVPLVEQDCPVLALGGDHAVTYPIVRAYGAHYRRLCVLHLDAHPDLYDEYKGNRFANACPFARIMEEGLVDRLVQVGIRAMNPHQREQAERFGVEVIEARHCPTRPPLHFDTPVYVSLDVDVLDPAFAPGVSHHEPGGLSTRDVIDLIRELDATVVGADIVEFNPTRDPLGITAMACAKLLKEIAAKMLRKGD
jgi:agmatinase